VATATLYNLMTDVLLNPGNPSTFGSAQSGTPTTTAVMNIQGSSAAACGWNTAETGSATPTYSTFAGIYNTVTSRNLSSVYIHIWLRMLYPVHDYEDGGLSIYLGSSGGSAIYKATGVNRGYSGEWFHFVLQVGAFQPDWTTGTYSSSSTTQIGSAANVTNSLGEDFLYCLFHDAIRTGSSGANGIDVTGGTSQDQLDFDAIALADTTTTSYGVFRKVGASYICEGEVHFGRATPVANCYFTESLQSVAFSDLPVGNSFYNIVGRAGGASYITSISLSDIVWSGPSTATKFGFDFSALDSGDTMTVSNNTFVFAKVWKVGPTTTVKGCTFVEVDEIVPNGATTFGNCIANNCKKMTVTHASDGVDNLTVNKHSTTANVAFLVTNSLTKVTNSSFENASGAGHAIEINTAGTYTFTGNTFAGYGAIAATNAAIYNSSGGLVTINVAGGGGTPTYRNGSGSSTVVNNNTTVTLTGMRDNTEVRVYTAGTTTELAGIEDATAGSADNRSFAFAIAAAVSVDIRIHNVTYEPETILAYTIPSTDTSIPIQQRFDRNYENP